MTATIHQGVALTVLRTLDSGSVHCCVTSPPYWALRRYSAGDQEMGSEPTSEAYLAAQVAVFREVRRVLRGDGVCWINIGDTMLGSGAVAGGGLRQTNTGSGGTWQGGSVVTARRHPKEGGEGNLAAIPYRLGLALQADGWLWRSTVIWQKLSPMPESVAGWSWEQHRVKVKVGKTVHAGTTGNGRNEQRLEGTSYLDPDANASWSPCPGCPTCAPNGGLVLSKGSWRPTKSHEYILMMVKSMGYFSNQFSVLDPAGSWKGSRFNGDRDEAIHPNVGKNGRNEMSTRNPRDVMTFAAAPQHGDPSKGYAAPVDSKHYASFPPSLPDFFIRASCPERCCAVCHAPWAPVVDGKVTTGHDNNHDSANRSTSALKTTLFSGRVLGLRPTCAHGDAWIPGTVLDCFAGTGTTLLAAERLGRNSIGIELSEQYIALARARLRGDAPLFA